MDALMDKSGMKSMQQTKLPPTAFESNYSNVCLEHFPISIIIYNVF